MFEGSCDEWFVPGTGSNSISEYLSWEFNPTFDFQNLRQRRLSIYVSYYPKSGSKVY
jgi:hypothetical protein